MELNLSDLKIILERLAEYSEGKEKSQLLDFAKNPRPEVRPFLISVRDQALAQAEFSWAVTLSHFIYAVLDPTFWDGATIKPSSL